jgi:hypothetical protein
MRSFIILLALAAQALLAPSVQAADPLKLYDRFSDKPLDPARWQEAERARFIKGGGLHLMQRTWGSDTSDFNLTAFNWSEPFTNPAAITTMRARVNVQALETSACPANGIVADARARLIGGYFNLGTATPGSMTNDVIAQLRIVRFSNSTDAPGVLRVQGIASICTSPDCAAAATIGNVVDLGTVAVGTATTLQLDWDQGGQTFRFTRDGVSGTVAYPYPTGANPPGVLFRQLATRVNAPNCTAGRVGGMVDVRYDNVFVNP